MLKAHPELHVPPAVALTDQAFYPRSVFIRFVRHSEVLTFSYTTLIQRSAQRTRTVSPARQ
jgi:hypothetical protein